jgi:hypothetical protein
MINYARSCILTQRERSRQLHTLQKKNRKLLNEQQQLQQRRVKPFKHTCLNESTSSSEASFNDCKKDPPPTPEHNEKPLFSPAIISTSNLPIADPYEQFFDNPGLFLPSRKEFFLYTIDEHQMRTQKTFTARKKVKDVSRGSASKMSKSDTNLAIIGIE